MEAFRSLPVPLVGFVVAALLPCVAGCVQISVDSRGTLPSEDKLASVKEGATSRDALIAAFGEPQYIRVLDDGKEVLVYEYRERETGKHYVPLIFEKGYQKTRVVRTYFQLANGVVTRYWKEEAPRTGAPRRSARTPPSPTQTHPLSLTASATRCTAIM
jgi:outer membrane protein assembly factor BamE (lipoprotein component of BamABCDE complex)